MRISDWSSDVCSSDLIARTNATARPRPEVILLQAFEKNDTMPDHTRSHTCLRNLVIASQFLARRPRITRNAMTAAMIRPMGFAIMARFHSHWAAVTTPVAMTPAIMAIRWAIVAAIFRASMNEARAREAIHAPMAKIGRAH